MSGILLNFSIIFFRIYFSTLRAIYSILEPLTPKLVGFEQLRKPDIRHLLAFLIHDVLVLQQSVGVTNRSLEKLRIDFLHELATRRELLLVHEDALGLITDFLVLDLSLEVNHVPLLGQILNCLLKAIVSKLIDLPNCVLIKLANSPPHLSFLVASNRSVHLLLSLLYL